MNVHQEGYRWAEPNTVERAQCRVSASLADEGTPAQVAFVASLRLVICAYTSCGRASYPIA